MKKYGLLIVLVIGLVLFFALGGRDYLSFNTLSLYYQSLQAFTQTHYFSSVLAFILVYIILVAFSVPGAAIMTLICGFLFGAILATLWVIIGATTGATISYLAVKLAFADLGSKQLKNKQSSIEKMRQGFQKNELNYLLFLRLMPIFPFFVINIAAGILNVKLSNFVLGTFFGIIPGSFIYSWTGSGLGFAFSQNKVVDMGIIFAPQILLPIIGLAILSLLPIIYQKIKAKRQTT